MLVEEMLRYKETGLFTIAPQQTLAEALAIMAENRVGVVVIMDGEKLVGLLTHRELIGAIYRKRDIEHTPVSECMIADPVTASPQMDIDELRRLMVKNRSRYLPVIDNGILRGAVSFLDVAKAVLDEQELENKMLKHYIRNWPEEEGENAQSAVGDL